MVFVFETGMLTNPLFIIKFPTKRHWREPSRIVDIDAGLATLVREVQVRQIGSIAVPPVGCGLGGLNWQDVKPRTEQAFASIGEVRVQLFQPT